MRDGSQTILERAFELARSGAVQDLPELRKRLSQEGYESSQIRGSSLSRQLRDLIAQAGRPEAPS